MWEKLQQAARKLGINSSLGTDLALFKGAPRKRARDISLVKSRPISAADHYALIHDDDTLDGVFHRLKAAMFSDIDEQRAKLLAQGIITPPMLREHGRVSAKRQYFYIKPPRDTGWLFERSGTGWVISRADKVVEENLFIRRGEPWDIVAVFGSDKATTLRVSSPRLRADLLSFNVYQRKLMDSVMSEIGPESSLAGQARS